MLIRFLAALLITVVPSLALTQTTCDRVALDKQWQDYNKILGAIEAAPTEARCGMAQAAKYLIDDAVIKSQSCEPEVMNFLSGLAETSEQMRYILCLE